VNGQRNVASFFAPMKYKHQYPTQHYNVYTQVLTRASFLHRDYLELYTKYAPERIQQMVAKEHNCEDIAMSFFVSYMSNYKLPLLADRWARSSSVKLVTGAKISTGIGHSRKRNNCTALFLNELDGLSENIHPHTLIHKKRNLFEDGVFEEEAMRDNKGGGASSISERESQLRQDVSTWKTKNYKKKRSDMIRRTSAEAYERGLVGGTIPWSKRFNVSLDDPNEIRFTNLFPANTATATAI
jgi:hypothetical protein